MVNKPQAFQKVKPKRPSLGSGSDLVPSVDTQLFLPMETGADFVLPDLEGNGGPSGTHYGGVHSKPLCVDETPKKKKFFLDFWLSSSPTFVFGFNLPNILSLLVTS